MAAGPSFYQSQSVSRLIGSILPANVRVKAKGFGDDRAGCPVKPKTDGIAPNRPGPSGFHLADAHFVGRTWPMNHIDLRRPSHGSSRQMRNRMNPIRRDTLYGFKNQAARDEPTPKVVCG